MCSPSCKIASRPTSYCGDGKVDSGNREECDNNSAKRNDNCKIVYDLSHVANHNSSITVNIAKAAEVTVTAIAFGSHVFADAKLVNRWGTVYSSVRAPARSEAQLVNSQSIESRKVIIPAGTYTLSQSSNAVYGQAEINGYWTNKPIPAAPKPTEPKPKPKPKPKPNNDACRAQADAYCSEHGFDWECMRLQESCG